MTILNAWIKPDRAVVLVDTEGYDARWGTIELSKAVPLIDSNTLIAVRGSGGLTGVLYDFHCRTPLNFDVLVEMMPASAEKCREHYVKAAAEHGLTIADLSTVDQVGLFGWSDKNERMQGWLFVREAGEHHFTPRKIEPWNIAPAADFDASLPWPENHADLERIGRRQTAWHRKHYPGRECAIGGRLICAEITRRSMTITELCEIEDDRPTP